MQITDHPLTHRIALTMTMDGLASVAMVPDALRVIRAMLNAGTDSTTISVDHGPAVTLAYPPRVDPAIRNTTALAA